MNLLLTESKGVPVLNRVKRRLAEELKRTKQAQDLRKQAIQHRSEKRFNNSPLRQNLLLQSELSAVKHRLMKKLDQTSNQSLQLRRVSRNFLRKMGKVVSVKNTLNKTWARPADRTRKLSTLLV